MEVLAIPVALMCVFGLGMCFALLGSLSVKLMPRLNIDQGKFGTLISAFMFSCLVASLIVGVLIDKIGYQPVAIVGFLLTAACIFVLAQGKTYMSAVIPCLLLGFGAMALNTAGNVMGPSVLFGGENPARASNLINVFFGLGLFLTPMVVSFLFRKTTYEKAVATLGVIVLAPVILAILAKYPETPAGFQLGNAVALLGKPAVLVGALVLFCYISLESSFCNWLPAYGKEVITEEKPDMEVGAVDASAQSLLSLFAVAMMVGRLIASQIKIITEYGGWFIAGAALLSTIVIIIMMKTKNAGQAKFLAVLGGLFFAPCFPTTVGVTFSNFDPGIHGSVFGIIFAVGLLGAVIIPKAIGNLAKGSSVRKGLKLLVPACVVLLILAIIMGQIRKPPEPASAVDQAAAAVEEAGEEAEGAMEAAVKAVEEAAEED